MTDLIKAADALAEEDAAKIIYDAMAWAYEDGSGNKCPAWVEHGNSHAQAEARAAASRIFTAYRQARESADGVKVKPLVWEAISDTSFRAKALMFGNVRVETYGAPWVINWSAPGYCDTLIAGEFDTPEAAKAAAQAYYEARIKAALDPQ
jgi:hypothetical protein